MSSLCKSYANLLCIRPILLHFAKVGTTHCISDYLPYSLRCSRNYKKKKEQLTQKYSSQSKISKLLVSIELLLHPQPLKSTKLCFTRCLYNINDILEGEDRKSFREMVVPKQRIVEFHSTHHPSESDSQFCGIGD